MYLQLLKKALGIKRSKKYQNKSYTRMRKLTTKNTNNTKSRIKFLINE